MHVIFPAWNGGFFVKYMTMAIMLLAFIIISIDIVAVQCPRVVVHSNSALFISRHNHSSNTYSDPEYKVYRHGSSANAVHFKDNLKYVCDLGYETVNGSSTTVITCQSDQTFDRSYQQLCKGEHAVFLLTMMKIFH